MQHPDLSNGYYFSMVRGKTLGHLHGCFGEYNGKLMGKRPSPVMSASQAHAYAQEQTRTRAQMLHSAAKQVSDAGATQREEKRQSHRDARTERVERARGKNGQFVAKKSCDKT